MRLSVDWLSLASKMVPENRKDWLTAMRAEYQNIHDAADRQKFARGCFWAVAGEWAQSRRGLSLLGRVAGAAILILFSIFGFLAARKMGLETERDLSVYGRIISTLCVAYLGVGFLILLSLRATRLFSALGFLLSSAALIWFLISPPVVAGVSAEFLRAISLETAGLMAALFMACIYLGWLYDPDGIEV